MGSLHETFKQRCLSNMKLALVIYGDLDQTTGGYLYDKKLVDYLRRQGDSVDVHSIKDHGYFRNLLFHTKHKHAHTIKPDHYDAVIIDELCHSAFVPALPTFRTQTCTIGLVHHLKASEPQPTHHAWASKLLERRFLNHQHGLICNSATTAGTCKALLGKSVDICIAKPGTITSVGNITPQRIGERATQTGPLRILFLGTVTPRKGLHHLLESIKRCSHPVEVSIVGSHNRDPKYAKLCKKYVSDLATHKVEFKGEIDTATLIQELESAHILAVPSDYEGYGIAYIEGFSAGLPCIATAKGAPPEFVQQGVNGFTVQPGDVNGIASHLTALSNDREKLKKMSLAARQTFESHSTWEQSFEGVRRFLESSIKKFRSTLP